MSRSAFIWATTTETRDEVIKSRPGHGDREFRWWLRRFPLVHYEAENSLAEGWRERERERENATRRRSGWFGRVGHNKRVWWRYTVFRRILQRRAASRRFLHVRDGRGGGEVSRTNWRETRCVGEPWRYDLCKICPRTDIECVASASAVAVYVSN